MAKEPLTDEEYARMKQQKGLQQEMEDLGVYGGHGVPGPTKKDLAKAKGKRYDDDEVQNICDLIIEHKGEIDNVLSAILEKRKEDKEFAVRLIDRPRLLSFVNNHIDDIMKAARTTKALPAILELCANADQSSVMLGAAKEVFNRADGMPTQKIEQTVGILTYSDVQAKFEADRKKYQPSGEWVKETESNTPVATDEPEE